MCGKGNRKGRNYGAAPGNECLAAIDGHVEPSASPKCGTRRVRLALIYINELDRPLGAFGRLCPQRITCDVRVPARSWSAQSPNEESSNVQTEPINRTVRSPILRRLPIHIARTRFRFERRLVDE